jgi:hypothetical protein
MWVLVALAGAALLFVLLRLLLTTPPADLARMMRRAGSVAAILVGVVLIILKQFAIAIPVIAAGVMLWRRIGAPRQGPGGQSSVRSAGLDMVLDHDTGEMDGQVLAGRHEGRRLSELSRPALFEIAEDFRGDAESLRLLEGYLDRRHSGWREDVQADGPRRAGATSRTGGMSAQEAYEILGLQPGAGEAEVREAHRRLMKQVHPDRGGSAALAAQINEAKNRILGKHR